MTERHCPSPLFQTDYASLSSVRVRAAYLLRAVSTGIQAHSAWLFVTEDNRVIVSRGGPELEPRAAHFGTVAGATVRARLGLAAVEATYNFGRLVATTQELAEVARRTNPTRTPTEDAVTKALDIVNFLEVMQGSGIEGLRPRPNVVITPMALDAGRAQMLFQAALDVNRMLDRGQFAYGLLPRRDGGTGINSHTVSALIAERADELARARGLRPGHLAAYGRQSRFLAGASTSLWPATGPALAVVRAMADAGPAGNPAHYGHPPLRGRRPIPHGHLMPYSQRVPSPR
jgi:hypothetical protein